MNISNLCSHLYHLDFQNVYHTVVYSFINVLMYMQMYSNFISYCYTSVLPLFPYTFYLKQGSFEFISLKSNAGLLYNKNEKKTIGKE